MKEPNLYSYLATLPAILGVTVFVVYFFIFRSRTGDRVTLDIVATLRRDAPESLSPEISPSDPATLAKILRSNAAIRAKVNEQDFQLLQTALRQQHTSALVVYGISAVLFLFGVSLYVFVSTRPQPLVISSIAAASTDPQAKGLAVDTDALRITWAAKGPDENLKVSLQNAKSAIQTGTQSARSSDDEITFQPADYGSILTNRDPGGFNSIRVVLKADNDAFVSQPFDVHVGTTIEAIKMSASRIKMMGMIDDSAIPSYNFDATLEVWGRNRNDAVELRSFGGHVVYGQNDFRIDPLFKYEWSTAKLHYLGRPDDPRVVRVALLGF